jgi:hypothetical protein
MENEIIENDSEHGHDKKFTIIINGRKKEVTERTLSYEDIVNLAFDNNPPIGPNVVITVTYAKGDHDRQGTLLPGQTIKIRNGMVFNVKATDRS